MSHNTTLLTFADRIAPMELRDPLAELLGVLPANGTLRYTYMDAVKLCGHSCPTVAGAWLMATAALAALYPGEVPARGGVEVTVGGAADDGASGPVAQVIGLLTGAAPDTGFGGLMGHHRRMHLLRFDKSLGKKVRFRRSETRREVEVVYDPSTVPSAPEMMRLLVTTLSGKASDAERQRFGELWQARVEAILLGERSRVLTVTDTTPPKP